MTPQEKSHIKIFKRPGSYIMNYLPFELDLESLSILRKRGIVDRPGTEASRWETT